MDVHQGQRHRRAVGPDLRWYWDEAVCNIVYVSIWSKNPLWNSAGSRGVTLYLFGVPGLPNAELGPQWCAGPLHCFAVSPPCFARYFAFLRTNIQTYVQKYVQNILFTLIGNTPVFMVRILSVITFRYAYECSHDTERSDAVPPPPNRFDKVTPLAGRYSMNDIFLKWSLPGAGIWHWSVVRGRRRSGDRKRFVKKILCYEIIVF